MAVLKKVAVPLLLAAASALLLAGPADAASGFRSLKNNNGGNKNNNNQQDNWVDNNDNWDDDNWSSSSNHNNRPQYSPPEVTCLEAATTTTASAVTAKVCPADGEEAKHGFKLEWLSEEAFVANNGFGCNSTDAAEGICSATISEGDLEADGCAIFVIGEKDQNTDLDYKPKACKKDLGLECDEKLVFRAYTLGRKGGRGKRTSEPSEPETCKTAECTCPPTDACAPGQECADECATGQDRFCTKDCPANTEDDRDIFGDCVCKIEGQFVIDGVCKCAEGTELDDLLMPTKCVPICTGECDEENQECVAKCEDGKSNECVLPCPAEATRDDYGCCVCPENQVFDSETGKCVCEGGSILDTMTMVCECPPGKEFNECGVCVCEDGTETDPDDETECVPIPGYGDLCINSKRKGGETEYRCGVCVNNCGNEQAGVCETYQLFDPKCKTSAAGGGGKCEGELVCCAPFKPSPAPFLAGDENDLDTCETYTVPPGSDVAPLTDPLTATFDATVEEIAP